MAIEIERKFLVDPDAIKAVIANAPRSKRLRQYYLTSSPELAIRIRIEEETGSEILAIKSGTDPMRMNEFEFVLPSGTYDERSSEMVGIEIDKVRYLVEFDGRTWEIDKFFGELNGLIVAEVECDDAADITHLPEWATREVTHDTRFKNARLALEVLSEINPSKD